MTWADEQAAAFNELADTFGATASWAPSLGGEPVDSQPVLFESPTRGIGIDAPGDGLNTRFDIADFVLTAEARAFTGLKTSVDSGRAEVLTIAEDGRETGRFHVRSVRHVGDGKLIEVRLSNILDSAHAQQDRGQPDPAVARLLAGRG